MHFRLMQFRASGPYFSGLSKVSDIINSGDYTAKSKVMQ